MEDQIHNDKDEINPILTRKMSKKKLRRMFSSSDDEPDPIGPIASERPLPPDSSSLISPKDKNTTPDDWLIREEEWNGNMTVDDIDHEYTYRITCEFMSGLLSSDIFNGNVNLAHTVCTIEALKLIKDVERGQIQKLNLALVHFIDEESGKLSDPQQIKQFLSEILEKQGESLITLNLGGTIVIPEFVKDGLSNLEWLSLAKTQLTRDQLEAVVEACPNLQLISLQFVNRQLRDFGALSKLKNIKKLWLSGSKIGDKDLTKLCTEYKENIVDLRINDCTGFKLMESIDQLPNLTTIYAGNQNRPSLGLGKIAKHGKLEIVSLRSCNVRVTDLEILAAKCGATLKKLEINNLLLDFEVWAEILGSCNVIEALAVENGSKAETAIVIGGYASPTLQYLSFRNCPQIETSELEALAEERLCRLEDGVELEFLTCLHSAFKMLKLDVAILKKFKLARFTVVHDREG